MRLHERGLPPPKRTDSFVDAAENLVAGLAIELRAYGFTPSGTVPIAASAHPGDEKLTFDRDKTRAKAMADLARSVEESFANKRGRGMLMIRRGTLLLGPRDIPLGRSVTELSLENGLLESVRDRPQPEAGLDDPAKPPDPGRPQYHLTLKGRPDLLPGDVVRFRPDPLDDGQTTGTGPAILGGLVSPLLAQASTQTAGHAVRQLGRAPARAQDRVRDDDRRRRDQGRHRLQRRLGRRPGPGLVPTAGRNRASRLDAERQGRCSSRGQVGRGRQGGRGPHRRDRRGARHQRTAHGEYEPPSQTEAVYRGLVTPDGRANQARRLTIRRTNPVLAEGVAYASPFAWGPCGLVLPRYPGTRVVLVHRNGERRRPDRRRRASGSPGPGPDSLPGDWWLILPAGMSGQPRERSSRRHRPETWFGETTNDLIDGDGNRIIQVGELTIRVGRPLPEAGDRPDRAALKQGVTIEHAAGDARITIDKDGKIVVEAKSDLKLVSKAGRTSSCKPRRAA